MKLVSWLILYDQMALRHLHRSLPIHPLHNQVLDVLSSSGWIIDLDMKSACGAWICLRGLFCGKGFAKDSQDIDCVLQIIAESTSSFLEISPIDSLEQIYIEKLTGLGFVKENNCGLNVMRWYNR